MIFILADDPGWGDLGGYQQERERSCGPASKVFKSIAPAERLSGATINWLLSATLINCPVRSLIRFSANAKDPLA